MCVCFSCPIRDLHNRSGTSSLTATNFVTIVMKFVAAAPMEWGSGNRRNTEDISVLLPGTSGNALWEMRPLPLPSTIRDSPSTIHHPRFTIRDSPSANHHPRITIRESPSAIHHPRFTIRDARSFHSCVLQAQCHWISKLDREKH
jgi:hypothetical protein